MNKPDHDELQDFFRSEIFKSEEFRRGDFTHVIKEFYQRFYPDFNQLRYNEIGVQVTDIKREPIVFEETGIVGEHEDHPIEHKTTIQFYFIQNPDIELTFSLIGLLEEKSFFDATKKELGNFFIFKFRRFSKFIIS